MVTSSISRCIQVFVLVFAPGVFAIAAPAGAGLPGKWSGTVDIHDTTSGSVVSTPIQVQFEETQPGVISGKIGREGETDTVAIRNAKLDGDKVSFEAASSETTGPMTFTLVLNGNHLDGQIKGAVESQDIQGDVKLSRETK